MGDGKVVVVGSAVADLAFQVAMLPFPGDTATASSLAERLGGKGANQAAAAARLGAPTAFVGCVGDDDAGRRTREDLEARGIELHLRTEADLPTGRAAVIVDEEGENQITVFPGANAALGVGDVQAVRDLVAEAAVLVVQLEVPPETVRAALEIAREAEVRTILNAAPARDDAKEDVALAEIVVVNRTEAEHLAGVGVMNLDDAHAAVRGLRDLGAELPIVTLGAGGAVGWEHGRTRHVPAPAAQAVDTTGAGDAFVGALAALLREGQEVGDALAGACRYAAMATLRPGTREAYADREAFDAAAPADD